MFNTELYKVFFITASCKNISKAAEILFVSQPAISKSIRKLENVCGCTLFIRNARGVTLTTEGEVLFDYVKSAFEKLDDGEKILEKLKSRTEGIVKLGVSETLCRYFLMPYLEAFHYQYPGLRIQIINRTSPETLKLLEQGQLDFGIISIPINREEQLTDFNFVELKTIQDTFVATKKYAFDETPLPLDKLAHYPLLMLEDKNLSRIYIDEYFKKNHTEFVPEIEISSMDLLIEFAKIGLGVAAVIQDFVQEELSVGNLKEIRVHPQLPPRKIGLALKKDIPVSLASNPSFRF